MDELLAKHRKEQRDLVSRITQKKKSATKKTRKGVNDECERLERELKEKHAAEVAGLNGEPVHDDGLVLVQHEDEDDKKSSDPAESPPAGVIVDQTAALKSDESQSQSRRPNRHKARLARRAAEQQRAIEAAEAEAKEMPDLKAQEKAAMEEAFEKHKVYEKLIHADGHCLYAAVADQVRQREEKLEIIPLEGKEDDYKIVRKVAADYIVKHPEDFLPFIEEDLESYVVKVRDTGEWGGQIELLALARAYGLHICVLQGDGSVTDVGEGGDDKKIWLAYYRHNFGLGEHYNSLRSLKD